MARREEDEPAEGESAIRRWETVESYGDGAVGYGAVDVHQVWHNSEVTVTGLCIQAVGVGMGMADEICDGGLESRGGGGVHFQGNRQMQGGKLGEEEQGV
ncbi:hypothetical protein CLOM_g2189 [Closterium sp. NIES-68]|nr:hypothetical protein CLOM_g2189 [Closterium sp. NIES-68]